MLQLDSIYVWQVLLALTVAGIALLYRWFSAKFNFFLDQGVKGLTPTVPTGTWQNAWKLIAGEEDLERVKKFGKIFGTFDGPKPNLVICDPQLIKQVLQDESEKYRSRRAFRVKNQMLHKSLLAIEGVEDKAITQVISSPLSSENISKLVPRINKAVETLVQQIMKESSNKKVNVSKSVVDFLGDALAFTIFGLDISADEKLKTQFIAVVSQAFTITNPQSPFAMSPFLFESLGSLDDFILRKESVSFLTTLCTSILNKRRSEGITVEGKAVDFLDLLLKAAEDEKNQVIKEKEVNTANANLLLSDQEIVTQCIRIILTVIQESRYSLALAIYTLGNAPTVQEKLRAELEKMLIKHSTSSYNLVQEAEYLDMFLAEILRLYPYEYRLERECIQPSSVGEVKLVLGNVVSIPIYALHRLPENYPNPDEFDPERFSPQNSAKRDNYIYLPFGQAGRSSSNIGIRLSVLITKLAIAALVTAFQMTAVEGSKIPAPFQRGFTGIPQPEELWIKVSSK